MKPLSPQGWNVLIAVLIILFLVVLFAVPGQARAALFSSDAGFHHARFDTVSITVQRTDGFAKGINYWNDRAEWDLFVFVDSDAEITTNLDPDNHCRSCALVTDPYGKWSEPYIAGNVDIVPKWRDTQTVAHELGHLLGFRHQLDGVMEAGKMRVGPQDFAFDRDLLINAGYRMKS